MSRGGLEIRDFFAINNRLGIRKIEFQIFFVLFLSGLIYFSRISFEKLKS